MLDTTYAASLAAYRPPNFAADTPVASSGAPKITLLPESVATPLATGGVVTEALQQPSFTGTLMQYMRELGGPDASEEDTKHNRVAQVASVGDTVKSYFQGVSDQIVQSDRQTRDLVSGKTNDVGAVTASVEEADLALDMMLALTKRMTSTYQTIQNITI
jgi:flagellar hook-basal body complex protein FliE